MEIKYRNEYVDNIGEIITKITSQLKPRTFPTKKFYHYPSTSSKEIINVDPVLKKANYIELVFYKLKAVQESEDINPFVTVIYNDSNIEIVNFIDPKVKNLFQKTNPSYKIINEDTPVKEESTREPEVALPEKESRPNLDFLDGFNYDTYDKDIEELLISKCSSSIVKEIKTAIDKYITYTGAPYIYKVLKTKFTANTYEDFLNILLNAQVEIIPLSLSIVTGYSSLINHLTKLIKHSNEH